MAEVLSRRHDPGRMARMLGAAGLVPVLLVIAIVVFGAVEPRFLSSANVSNVLRNASYLALVSSGQMLVMTLGGIDLSVGVMVAFGSVGTALSMQRLGVLFPAHETLVILLSCALTLALCAIVGAITGLLITLTKASAFMVTLGSFTVIGGICYYVTSGIPIYGMPTLFTRGFGRAALLGVPWPVTICAALVLGIAVAQRHLNAGRWLYASGGNPSAARASGIPVARLTVMAYALCSCLAGLAGLLLTARIGSGQANLGSEFMLQSIGAAVLAGVSLRGGVGRAEMVAVSSLFLAVLANGMNLVRIDSKLQTIVFGALVLTAIVLDRRRNAGRDYD